MSEKAVGAWGTGHLCGLLHKRNQCMTSIVCTVPFMGVLPDPFPQCASDWVLWSSAPPSCQFTDRSQPSEVRASRQNGQEDARPWEVGTWSPKRLSRQLGLGKSPPAWTLRGNEHLFPTQPSCTPSSSSGRLRWRTSEWAREGWGIHPDQHKEKPKSKSGHVCLQDVYLAQYHHVPTETHCLKNQQEGWTEDAICFLGVSGRAAAFRRKHYFYVVVTSVTWNTLATLSGSSLSWKTLDGSFINCWRVK